LDARVSNGLIIKQNIYKKQLQEFGYLIGFGFPIFIA